MPETCPYCHKMLDNHPVDPKCLEARIRDLEAKSIDNHKVAHAAAESMVATASNQIRGACGPCGGRGGYGGGVHYVTREMAMDAGDMSLEGQKQVEEPIPCEYCGWPMNAMHVAGICAAIRGEPCEGAPKEASPHSRFVWPPSWTP